MDAHSGGSGQALYLLQCQGRWHHITRAFVWSSRGMKKWFGISTILEQMSNLRSIRFGLWSAFTSYRFALVETDVTRPEAVTAATLSWGSEAPGRSEVTFLSEFVGRVTLLFPNWQNGCGGVFLKGSVVRPAWRNAGYDYSLKWKSGVGSHWWVGCLSVFVQIWEH